jgi:hypothetical protein
LGDDSNRIHPPASAPLRVQAVIEAAASLKYLKTFQLTGLDDEHNLAPLQRCRSLRSLDLSWLPEYVMSVAQASVLRDMRQLKQLTFGHVEAEEETETWIRLLSEPPLPPISYPPLHSITIQDGHLNLTPELIAVMPRLPS